jgi:hypothetical protein
LTKAIFYGKNKSTIRYESGMFPRGNCHVKIIKTFARNGEGFYVYNKNLCWILPLPTSIRVEGWFNAFK